MNIKQIIDRVREDVLDDTVLPYGWSNDTLVAHLNRCYKDLLRETLCLTDSSTASICRVNLLANQTMHAISPLILYIFDMRRDSDGYPILKRSESFMQMIDYGWRESTGTPLLYVPDTQSGYFSVYQKFDTVGYVAGVSNIQFVATGKHITQVGGTFTDHYAIGDTIVIAGTTLNNGTFTAVTVADTDMTVAETITNEINQSAVIQLVRDIAVLRVARLPLVDWTANDLELATPPTPEINATYHYGLLDGIAKYAYLKPDVETYNPGKAVFHKTAFDEFKQEVKVDILILTSESDAQCAPHYGAL